MSTFSQDSNMNSSVVESSVINSSAVNSSVVNSSAVDSFTVDSSVKTEKYEKFSDSSMYNDDCKALYSFITKLHLKLEQNADRYSTDEDKINYKMSHLKEDAAVTVDLFF